MASVGDIPNLIRDIMSFCSGQNLSDILYIMVFAPKKCNIGRDPGCL
jgi:hypothetical protein